MFKSVLWLLVIFGFAAGLLFGGLALSGAVSGNSGLTPAGVMMPAGHHGVHDPGDMLGPAGHHGPGGMMPGHYSPGGMMSGGMWQIEVGSR